MSFAGLQAQYGVNNLKRKLENFPNGHWEVQIKSLEDRDEASIGEWYSIYKNESLDECKSYAEKTLTKCRVKYITEDCFVYNKGNK